MPCLCTRSTRRARDACDRLAAQLLAAHDASAASSRKAASNWAMRLPHPHGSEATLAVAVDGAPSAIVTSASR